MTNEAFNAARREAEITSAEMADFIGVSRIYMYRIEIGREEVPQSIVNALHAMIATNA